MKMPTWGRQRLEGCIYKPGNTRGCQPPPGERGQAWDSATSEPPEGTSPASPLPLRFWPPDCVRGYLPILSYQVCSNLLWQPQELITGASFAGQRWDIKVSLRILATVDWKHQMCLNPFGYNDIFFNSVTTLEDTKKSLIWIEYWQKEGKFLTCFAYLTCSSG